MRFGKDSEPIGDAANQYLKEVRDLGLESAEAKIQSQQRRQEILGLPGSGVRFVQGVATGGIPADRVLGPLGLAALSFVTLAAVNQGVNLVEKLANRHHKKSIFRLW